MKNCLSPSLRLFILGLLTLNVLVQPGVSGFRIHLPRNELTNLVSSSGEAAEERLYMDRCVQSNKDGKCYRALDGDVFKEWTQCSSTIPEAHPQWSAHLEIPAYITRIVIHTVELLSSDMVNGLSDFDVQVGHLHCFTYNAKEFFESKSFPCDAFGDEITIFSNVENSAGSYLVLCEVEVYGVPVRLEGLETSSMELNIAGCEQNGDASPNEKCERAMDRVFVQHSGVKEKHCSRTESAEISWMKFMLENPAMVTNVKLFNLLDPGINDRTHITVFVEKQKCGVYNEPKGFNQHVFECAEFGADVLILNDIQHKHLSLCQVQVFGHDMMMEADILHKPVGCFADNPDDPDLEVLAATTFMTPNRCHKICRRKNKAKFGLQNGRVCFCGQKHGRYGESGNCTMPCLEDRSKICGGRRANSIFEILK